MKKEGNVAIHTAAPSYQDKEGGGCGEEQVLGKHRDQVDHQLAAAAAANIVIWLIWLWLVPVGVAHFGSLFEISCSLSWCFVCCFPHV